MKKTNIVIALILSFVSFISQAQSHNEEVTVQGSYTPHIKKSERIITNPELKGHDFTIPKYEINTEDFFFNYKVDLEPISPLQYTSNKTEEITNNFIKLGIGTRLSPDFLFRHYSDLSKKSSIGIGVTHNSTWLDMKDYANSKYMNNAFSLSMSNRFSGFQLHSFIDYHYDMYHLYGVNNDSIVSDNITTPKRDIHSLNIKLLANNNQSSYKSIYDEFMLSYNYSGIIGGLQENHMYFKAKVEHSNSWFKNSEGTQTLSIDINTEINNIESTLFLLSANPYLAFDGDYYKLHLGFSFDVKTNSMSKGGIYPDIKGSLYLFRRKLELYASMGGRTKINTLKEILSENPFVVGDIRNFSELDYEKTSIDLQAGLKFKIYNNISGLTGIRYRNVNNHIFYVSSLNNINTFDIVWNNCKIFNFIANVDVMLKENISLAADFSYNKYDIYNDRYTLDVKMTETQAWYMPEIEFRLKGTYKMNENWNFKLATYVEGSRHALIDYKETKTLEPICDIQLGCDYKYNKDLSFYAEIKNLIHNKYQMYYGYPSYGLQMFIGFKYRFL